MSDLEFDNAITRLTEWAGQNVSVQVLGKAELALHIDGELQQIQDPGSDLVLVHLDNREDATVWLWRDHVDRVFWIDTAETTLGFETQGLMVSVGLDAVPRESA